MSKILDADQGLPYKLMKNKFLYREQYKEFLYIVNKNIPNITEVEVIELFESLSSSGCSCAMLANVLFNQINIDPVTFKNIFGFSILSKGNNNIDCNKLMVDIYSKLYGVMKVRFIEYDSYAFSSVKEAALNLLGTSYSDESEASVALFNSGIISDGLDLNGNFLFKKTEPKITNKIGTCESVAKEMFGIDGVKSLDQLQNICTKKGIILQYKDLKIYDKLTGLGTENFNFWSNYYLQSYNVDFDLNKEAIIVSDFKDSYEGFMKYINSLVSEGYSVSVSSKVNGEAYMHTNAPMSWGRISSDNAGHVMMFKEFNKNKDIVVSSYGKGFIIPKEYFQHLEFNKIKKFIKKKKMK